MLNTQYPIKDNTLAVKTITSIGGLIIHPDTQEGLFTIKLGDTSKEAKLMRAVIEEKRYSIEEIMTICGLGLGKGKQRDCESRDQTLLREISEELGPKEDDIKRIGHIGRFPKYRQYYTKYISMDLFLLLDTQKIYTPSDYKHLAHFVDLKKAVPYMKSQEEREFLERNIHHIMDQISKYKLSTAEIGENGGRKGAEIIL